MVGGSSSCEIATRTRASKAVARGCACARIRALGVVPAVVCRGRQLLENENPEVVILGARPILVLTLHSDDQIRDSDTSVTPGYDPTIATSPRALRDLHALMSGGRRACESRERDVVTSGREP